MKNFNIRSLFSTPIYTTNIDRKFTKQELDFVYKQKNYCKKNEGNLNTIDSYILKQKVFKDINKFLEEHCQSYLNNIICPKFDLKLLITQSWLNYTSPNQYHHKHRHPNSIVSGVLYFDCDVKYDKIYFANTSTYKQIKPVINDDKYNDWNSSTWWFPVETGNLFLFPSSTEHFVDTKQGTNTRISLAFNTFYKGTLGENNELSELII